MSLYTDGLTTKPLTFLIWKNLCGQYVHHYTYISCVATECRQFDLKFTKGNTIVKPEKLKYFQKKHAQRKIETRGPVFDSMVEKIYDLVRKYLQLYPE